MPVDDDGPVAPAHVLGMFVAEMPATDDPDLRVAFGQGDDTGDRIGAYPVIRAQQPDAARIRRGELDRAVPVGHLREHHVRPRADDRNARVTVARQDSGGRIR